MEKNMQDEIIEIEEKVEKERKENEVIIENEELLENNEEMMKNEEDTMEYEEGISENEERSHEFWSKFYTKLAVVFILAFLLKPLIVVGALQKQNNDASFEREISNAEFSKIRQNGYSGVESIRSEICMIDTMHKIANTKIVAYHIRGRIEPNRELINSLILEVEASDDYFNYRLKDQLLKILYDWRKGDFSNAVEDHNFLLDCLDGKIGGAIALRPGVMLESALKNR